MAAYLEPKVLAFKAGAAIGQYNIVKFGADDEHVVEGSAGADLLMGVAMSAALVAEEPVEVAVANGAKVKLGGTVARGALLTVDSGGLAVTAATTNRVIGQAMASGVANDVIPMIIFKSLLP